MHWPGENLFSFSSVTHERRGGGAPIFPLWLCDLLNFCIGEGFQDSCYRSIWALKDLFSIPANQARQHPRDTYFFTLSCVSGTWIRSLGDTPKC